MSTTKGTWRHSRPRRRAPQRRLGQRTSSARVSDRRTQRDRLHPSPTESRARVDRLLTADELAERLGMKTEWVWAQARAGRIPHVRLGRYRRFRESAVEDWLRDLETGGSGGLRARSPPHPSASARVARRPVARQLGSLARRCLRAADSRLRGRQSPKAHVRQQIDGQLMDTFGDRPCPLLTKTGRLPGTF